MEVSICGGRGTQRGAVGHVTSMRGNKVTSEIPDIRDLLCILYHNMEDLNVLQYKDILQLHSLSVTMHFLFIL